MVWIEEFDIDDIEFGEPIEKKEPNYRDGYIQGIYRARNIIDSKQKEIERLNKLISQREKKWEKWTTEKTILSTKMSDYLCKYQNIKREYTKQIKISTDRKKEIERLNNIINELEKWLKEMQILYGINQQVFSWGVCGEALDKLQELKGSDKE